jgi:hypothetical protein
MALNATFLQDGCHALKRRLGRSCSSREYNYGEQQPVGGKVLREFARVIGHGGGEAGKPWKI